MSKVEEGIWYAFVRLDPPQKDIKKCEVVERKEEGIKIKIPADEEGQYVDHTVQPKDFSQDYEDDVEYFFERFFWSKEEAEKWTLGKLEEFRDLARMKSNDLFTIMLTLNDFVSEYDVQNAAEFLDKVSDEVGVDKDWYKEYLDGGEKDYREEDDVNEEIEENIKG